MSDASVVSIRGADIASARRAQVLNHVASSYDNYVAKFGVEPDAHFMVLCGIRQDTSASWLVSGESEGGSSALLALSGAALMADSVRRFD